MSRHEIVDLSGKNSKGFFCLRLKIVEVKNGKAIPDVDESSNNKSLSLCIRSGKGRGGLPGECKCYKCKEIFENVGSHIDISDESYSDE